MLGTHLREDHKIREGSSKRGRIQNVGLMNQRLSFSVFGGVLFMSGILLFVGSQRRASVKSVAGSSAVRRGE